MTKPFLTVDVFLTGPRGALAPTVWLLNRVSLDWDTYQSEHADADADADAQFPVRVPLTLPGGDAIGYFVLS